MKTWGQKLRALLCRVFYHSFGPVVPKDPEWVLVSCHQVSGTVEHRKEYGYYGQETCSCCGHQREHFHFLPKPWAKQPERARLN